MTDADFDNNTRKERNKGRKKTQRGKITFKCRELLPILPSFLSAVWGRNAFRFYFSHLRRIGIESLDAQREDKRRERLLLDAVSRRWRDAWEWLFDLASRRQRIKVSTAKMYVCVYVYTLVGEVKFYLFLSLGRAKVTAPVDVGWRYNSSPK